MEPLIGSSENPFLTFCTSGDRECLRSRIFIFGERKCVIYSIESFANLNTRNNTVYILSFDQNVLSIKPDICVPCNEMLLNHLPGGVGVVTSLTLMPDVQVDRRLVRVEIGFRATDMVALGTRVAPHRDVLVFAVHVRLQVAFCCTPILTVLALKFVF